ncbi:MAG: DEAD/DEAH box helicase, partial [Burkholderiales bacterium PBB5]
MWQRAGVGRLQLWPHKAAFDPDLGLLLVADAHIGKAQSFRRLGVPVPAGTTAEALDRLSALLQATGATQLVFLGDFLHAATGRSAGTLAALAAWRDRHPALALTLVRGNHDAHAGDPPASL